MLQRQWVLLCILVCFSAQGIIRDSPARLLIQEPNHDVVSEDFDFIRSHTLADNTERKDFKTIKLYRCVSTDALIDFQYSYQPHRGRGGEGLGIEAVSVPEFFSKHALLTHLRNKTLAIMGDSLGLQLFYSLDASLMSERSSINLTLSRPKNQYHLDRGVANYEHYNASLHYYQAPTHRQAISLVLSGSLLHIDILLITIGAWYKPGFQHSPRNLTAATERYDFAVHTLRAAITKQQQHRKKQQQPQPLSENTDTTSASSLLPCQSLRVLWQLNAHMGPIDDDRYKHLAKHNDGAFWDQFPIEAEWVPIFNTVLRKVSREHSDTVLDTYTISKQLLRHKKDAVLADHWSKNHQSFSVFNAGGAASEGNISSSSSSSSPLSISTSLKVHADSLHYCQGGVFRAVALLLQKLLRHRSVDC